MSEPPIQSDDKKKVDPGWNDPPMLNYSAANPPPKSRITNKRIAFPMAGSTVTDNATPNTGNAPPLSTSHGPPKD